MSQREAQCTSLLRHSTPYVNTSLPADSFCRDPLISSYVRCLKLEHDVSSGAAPLPFHSPEGSTGNGKGQHSVRHSAEGEDSPL
jgi:hypothetical protein